MLYVVNKIRIASIYVIFVAAPNACPKFHCKERKMTALSSVKRNPKIRLMFWFLLITVLLVTYLLYGKELSIRKSVNMRVDKSSLERSCAKYVPRIIHLTWYGSNRPVFRFHHVISVMASLRFIRPQRVIFWHDRVPTGKWWQFIQQKINESTTTLVMMQRNGPKAIFGNPVLLSEHQSDVVRLEAVMKYGGIYHDLDVVIVRPLDPLFCYETTMGEELPDSLCNGFFMSVANTTFLRLWYDSYRTFKSEQWGYHSVIMPGIIAKRHPELIHVEKDTIHKPNWTPHERRQLYADGVFYNWTARNYAVHLWYRFHHVDYDPESIKRLNKTIGQIFRYIFYGNADMI